jgi:hypothetical protein
MVTGLRYYSVEDKKAYKSEWLYLAFIASTLEKKFDAIQVFKRYGFSSLAFQPSMFQSESYRAYVERYLVPVDAIRW